MEEPHTSYVCSVQIKLAGTLGIKSGQTVKIYETNEFHDYGAKKIPRQPLGTLYYRYYAKTKNGYFTQTAVLFDKFSPELKYALAALKRRQRLALIHVMRDGLDNAAQRDFQEHPGNPILRHVARYAGFLKH